MSPFVDQMPEEALAWGLVLNAGSSGPLWSKCHFPTLERRSILSFSTSSRAYFHIRKNFQGCWNAEGASIESRSFHKLDRHVGSVVTFTSLRKATLLAGSDSL